MNMTDRIGEALLSLNEDALIHVEHATGLDPEGKAVGKPLKERVFALMIKLTYDSLVKARVLRALIELRRDQPDEPHVENFPEDALMAYLGSIGEERLTRLALLFRVESTPGEVTRHALLHPFRYHYVVLTLDLDEPTPASPAA